MQHRKPAVVNGRPSGTDGSDFSYRMVVDSRYTKVAKGKSRLSVLFFTQAIVQLVGVVSLLLSLPKGEGPNTLAISSTAIGFLSLLVGELGRRRSRVNFLRFYMFASSIAITISIARVGSSNFLAEINGLVGHWNYNWQISHCRPGLVVLSMLMAVLYMVIQDQSRWDAKTFELVSIAGVVLGLLLQIFTVSTTISLIHNMSPPKRAS